MLWFIFFHGPSVLVVKFNLIRLIIQRAFMDDAAAASPKN